MTRILIVEDNPVEAREISFFLERAGFRVAVVDSAERGFECLKREPFDLVISDLHLPGENGIRLCRKIRLDESLREVPIVLLTRFSDPLNVLHGLDAGADGFISKGQDPANIVERLNRILMRKEAAAQGKGAADRIVFLQTEFEINAPRNQLLEVLLAGFEDTLLINGRYEEETRARLVAQKSLREADALYHSLVAMLPLSVVRKDLAGRYIFANRHFCETFQTTFEEIRGKTDFDLYPRDAAERFAREERRLMETREVVDAVETREGEGGQHTYWRVRKLPVLDSGQSVVGIQGIYWDITELKRSEQELRSLNASLEDRVAERTRALEEYARRLEDKNEELDRFVYVASHDLQEPVRKLISFSQLLERDVDADLNDKARRDLHYIVDSARRMQELVQDLLTLSRADRSAMQQEWTSLADCAQQALDALVVRIEQTGAEVTCDALPRVWGDPTMLTQLYQNLISNALKFIRLRNRPIVHLTAQRDGDEWILGVRDNGIGIEPQFATQIFAPFQRLHRRDQYEGTGIGLAICQTTVERHGGRIWVESKPGIGSHFKFTLPAAQRGAVKPEVMAHASE